MNRRRFLAIIGIGGAAASLPAASGLILPGKPDLEYDRKCPVCRILYWSIQAKVEPDRLLAWHADAVSGHTCVTRRKH